MEEERHCQVSELTYHGHSTHVMASEPRFYTVVKVSHPFTAEEIQSHAQGHAAHK